MRFPGTRDPKYYFPVSRRAARTLPEVTERPQGWYIVGLDEVIMDLEVHGSRSLGAEMGFTVGESVQLNAAEYRDVLERLRTENIPIRNRSAGGTVANSLNNYTFLSGEPAVLLGCIPDTIRPGDLAYTYVSQTPRAVSLDHLKPVSGHIGSALTYVTEEGERSFGVAPGIAGHYAPDDLPERLIHEASVVVGSLYCLRPATRPIAASSHRMMKLANEAGVPVAFGLGTATLVREMRDELRQLLTDVVDIAAMNMDEAHALTGETDALRAAQCLLEWVDLVVVTEGPKGLTLGGWTDDAVKRETREPLRSGSVNDFNRYEYSRVARRRDCKSPLKVFTHTHPYRGGPDRLANTNGAGDAALAALLHDVAANDYHRKAVPESAKHASTQPFLSYSSLSRNAQYCNRVAYEVLRSSSPRLHGPVGEDNDAP